MSGRNESILLNEISKETDINNESPLILLYLLIAIVYIIEDGTSSLLVIAFFTDMRWFFTAS